MTTKIAVSLPDELVADARTAVKEGRAESVSAYVADAMRHAGRRETLGEVVDAWELELGVPSDEARAWVEEQLRRVDE